jgi:hypothetical protein
MVNPSPEVIGRDFNNLKDDEGEESLISPIGEQDGGRCGFGCE